MATTTKRGPKAKPASKPGKWDKPALEVSATKKGPGRKAPASSDREISRTAVAPEPLKRLIPNVGRSAAVRHAATGHLHGWYHGERRVWRDGEPMHIVKPLRAARIAQARNEASA